MPRKPQGKTNLNCWIKPETRSALDLLAQTHGLTHNLNGKVVSSIGALLDLLTGGRFVILSTEEYEKLTKQKRSDIDASHENN